MEENFAKIKIGEEEQTFLLRPKTFRTGSRGFHGFGKMNSKDGKRYQINVLVIEIGSKGAKQ
ncbi:MAG: hypothetical protein ACTSPG_10175 [Candidatus Hodarchaeales archaeon]